MKKPIRLTLLMLVVGLLAGCKPTASSSEPSASTTEPSTTISEPESSSEEEVPPLTEAEFNLSVDLIAKTVPLVVERNTGTIVRTNIYRNAQDPVDPVPELKDGNSLTLIEGGTLTYEDDVNEVYLYPEYTITWSYNGQNDPETTLGTFVFEKDQDNKLMATPGYPTYEPEFDAQGNPVHIVPPAKVARLYATVRIGDWTKRLSIDMYLGAIEKINLISLPAIRDTKAGTVAKVRGYVTGVFPDWNTAGIADGKTGVGLYKLDASGFTNAFKVGDLVEAVGQVGNFNGLAQLSFIKAVKVLDKASFPEVKVPEFNDFTHDDLYQTLLLGNTDPTAPIFDKDNAMVRFDQPFTFKTVKDRQGNDIGLAGFVPDGKTHYNVILEGKTSEDIAFEVQMSMNYHMGLANHTAFKNFLVANENNAFFYEGPLTVYNELQFGPYQFEGSLRVAV